MPHIYYNKSISVAFFMDKKEWKSKITENTGLPKDVLLGLPYLFISGQQEVRIENFRGIIEYTDRIIRIQTKLGKINVCGQKMQIQNYSNDEMIIVGYIRNIEFYEE